MGIWSKFCGWLLNSVLGWKEISTPAKEKKCIVLGVPHTSMWDFVVSFLFYQKYGMTARIMVKSSLFKGPVGWFLRKFGAIPVSSSPAGMVKSIIDEMSKSESFHLAIAPEGTREPVKRWKSGYHMIAKATSCPVYLGFFDWKTKTISIGDKFELSDDAVQDTARMQKIYKGMKLEGKYPKKYITS